MRLVQYVALSVVLSQVEAATATLQQHTQTGRDRLVRFVALLRFSGPRPQLTIDRIVRSAAREAKAIVEVSEKAKRDRLLVKAAYVAIQSQRSRTDRSNRVCCCYRSAMEADAKAHASMISGNHAKGADERKKLGQVRRQPALGTSGRGVILVFPVRQRLQTVAALRQVTQEKRNADNELKAVRENHADAERKQVSSPPFSPWFSSCRFAGCAVLLTPCPVLALVLAWFGRKRRLTSCVRSPTR